MVEKFKERNMIKHVKGRSSKPALEELLVKRFREADINGNGTLEAEEFASCLRGIKGVGLTDGVIEIMWRVSINAEDANQDGKLNYAGFAPVMASLLGAEDAAEDANPPPPPTEATAAEAQDGMSDQPDSAAAASNMDTRSRRSSIDADAVRDEERQRVRKEAAGELAAKKQEAKSGGVGVERGDGQGLGRGSS